MAMTTSLPRGSLSSFLNTARSTLHSAIISQQRITLVIGNASADLDSIISSIVFAYIKTSAPVNTPLTNTSVNRHQPPNQYPPFYVPIVNCSRRDLHDRHELQALLNHAQLQFNHLITLDDLQVEPPAGLNPDNTSVLKPDFARLVVVGSCELSGRLSSDFGSCIIGYIDHTSEEQSTLAAAGNEPHVNVRAATCMSLIVEHCRESWDSLSLGGGVSTTGSAQSDSVVGIDDTNVRRSWDAQVAKLAMAIVLQSTNNLQRQDNTTEHDLKAYEYLDAKIALSDVTWNRQAFYHGIQQLETAD